VIERPTYRGDETNNPYSLLLGVAGGCKGIVDKLHLIANPPEIQISKAIQGKNGVIMKSFYTGQCIS
jgi:hypothetical protein